MIIYRREINDINLVFFPVHSSALATTKNLLIKDSIVKFYTGIPVKNNQGNINYRQEKVENHFRLVVVQNKK